MSHIVSYGRQEWQTDTRKVADGIEYILRSKEGDIILAGMHYKYHNLQINEAVFNDFDNYGLLDILHKELKLIEPQFQICYELNMMLPVYKIISW